MRIDKKTALIALLAIFNLGLIAKLLSEDRRNTPVSPATQEDEHAIATNDAPLYELFRYSHISEGLKVNDSIMLKKWDGSVSSIKDLAYDLPLLIFNFRYYNCRTCLDEELCRLMSLKQMIGHQKLILLSAFQDQRSHLAFEKEYGLEVWDIGNQTLGLPADQEGLPYLMVLDGDLTARNIYFPTSEFTRLTDHYYEIIMKKYFQ